MQHLFNAGPSNCRGTQLSWDTPIAFAFAVACNRFQCTLKPTVRQTLASGNSANGWFLSSQIASSWSPVLWRVLPAVPWNGIDPPFSALIFSEVGRRFFSDVVLLFKFGNPSPQNLNLVILLRHLRLVPFGCVDFAPAVDHIAAYSQCVCHWLDRAIAALAQPDCALLKLFIVMSLILCQLRKLLCPSLYLTKLSIVFAVTLWLFNIFVVTWLSQA